MKQKNLLLLSLKQLFWCNSYLGYSTKFWNKNMSKYILNCKNNIFFINLNYTLFLTKKFFKLLKIIYIWKRFIYIYLPDFFKIINLKKMHNNNLFITNKWLFGLITNLKEVLTIKKKKKKLNYQIYFMYQRYLLF